MRIVFTKLGGGLHHIAVERPAQPVVAFGPQPTDSVVPHDLVHAAVEQALGIADGFWGAWTEGATLTWDWVK